MIFNGRKLAEHILTKAASEGVSKVGVGIIAEQKDLKTWYDKIGFTESETKSSNIYRFTSLS